MSNTMDVNIVNDKSDLFLKNVQREVRNLRTEHGDRMNFDDAWDLAEAIDELIKRRIQEFADGVMK